VISFESRKVRHIVARLERGEALHDALGRLVEEHGIGAAWLSALGAFESCALCEYDQRAQAYRSAQRIDTPVEILNLTGNISFKDGTPFAHVHATVSREVGGVIEILGGHLEAATVFACELRLDVYDDLVLGREHDAATGLSLWAGEGEPAPPSRPSEVPTSLVEAPPAGGVSWAQVAEASDKPAMSLAQRLSAETVDAAPAVEPRLSLAERRRRAKARQAEQKKKGLASFGMERTTAPAFEPVPLPTKRRMTEAEFFKDPIPEVGDYVDHRVFGICLVEGESETGALYIRMENGIRKSIKLDIFEVQAPRDTDDRRIFALRPKRRK